MSVAAHFDMPRLRATRRMSPGSSNHPSLTVPAPHQATALRSEICCDVTRQQSAGRRTLPRPSVTGGCAGVLLLRLPGSVAALGT